MNRLEHCAAGLPTVRAAITYLGDTPEPPFMYYVAPPEGQPFTNVVDDIHAMEIADASPAMERFTLDYDGFQFVSHGHAFSDFESDERIRSEYFPVVEAFFRELLGIETVRAYDYALRRPDHGEARPDGIPVAGTHRRPIRRVHGDFARSSGITFGIEQAAALGLDLAGRRYRGFNLWRPIIGPLTDAPLAVCHPASVAETDLVDMRLCLGERRDGYISALRHNPAHRWFYRRGMERHEGIVFSSYDSALSCAQGVITHGAFDDPTAPTGGLPRASIEVRVFALDG